jgi:hypothetical protein
VEIVIPYSQIDNSQTITGVMDRIFKARGLDMSRHEVVKLENDPDKRVRVLTIRPKTYVI